MSVIKVHLIIHSMPLRCTAAVLCVHLITAQVTSHDWNVQQYTTHPHGVNARGPNNLFTAAACPYSNEWTDFSLSGKNMILGPAYQRDSEIWVHALLEQSFTTSCPFTCNLYSGAHINNQLLSSHRASCKPRYRTWRPADHRPYVISCKRNRQAQYIGIAHSNTKNLPLGYPTRIMQTKTTPMSNRSTDLAVCVPAVFSFQRTHQIDTFLAWYRYAGATRVFLYNHSWVNEIDLLIQAYNDKYPGYISVTQWKFRAGVGRAIATDGECWPNLGDLPTTQYLATNHCLMQAYLGGHTFTASIDLDEMLWNYHGADLQQDWLLTHMRNWQQTNPSMCSLEVSKPCLQNFDPACTIATHASHAD